MESDSKCPVTGGSHKRKAVGAMSNQGWWPNQLNLKILQPDTPRCPIPWARSSTTPRSSRASTWMP